ncbi:MAG: SDR family oxidoreductase [Halieaceae bacterium]|jgi:NAD(P)-dependent dehydrogenase (short-subunit alcohol dehydrogenase family)|nr:SDR family oxidoreductase [Halieaceae bacterium]
MDKVLDGKVALITGAGQGVGQGIAYGLAERGASIAVTGRTLSKCETTRDEIIRRGGEAIALECNIQDLDQMQQAVANTVERLGGIDILVNNAFSSVLGRLTDIEIEDFKTALNGGPVATLTMMQLCYPHLRKQGGSIINLGSTSSKRWDVSGYGAYAADKEAIRALTRAAACEWGVDNIRANVILPHATSPALKAWAEARPEEAAAFKATIPMKRIGDCEQDIGKFVAALCSPESSYVSGQSIAIDGGQAYMG